MTGFNYVWKDKYDEMAETAGKAAGLSPKQWPGLALILRSCARDAIRECVQITKDLAERNNAAQIVGQLDLFAFPRSLEVLLTESEDSP